MDFFNRIENALDSLPHDTHFLGLKDRVAKLENEVYDLEEKIQELEEELEGCLSNN